VLFNASQSTVFGGINGGGRQYASIFAGAEPLARLQDVMLARSQRLINLLAGASTS